MGDIRKVIVIGSGPAGYSAAIYLARSELKPLVFAGENWGGQLMLTTEVENYPGFEKGILGPNLMTEMRTQAERFGAEIVDKNVSKVDFSSVPFSVWAEEADYQAAAVIIATGAESRLVGVAGEKKFMGRGVSTCAVCDAPFYKDKERVFVVGGGDAAAEEVLALAKYAKHITLIHRRDTMKASKIMQGKIKALTNVDFRWNSELVEVIGEGNKAVGIKVKNNKTNEIEELTMDGVFIAIGHKPATEIFKDRVELDEKGYVVTGLTGDTKRTETWLRGFPTVTSVEGVFAAGDVVDFRYRQAITAAGFGCMASLDVEKWLTRK